MGGYLKKTKTVLLEEELELEVVKTLMAGWGKSWAEVLLALMELADKERRDV